MSAVKLTIAVPTRVRPAWLATSLACLAKQCDRADVEVIVGDNAGPPTIRLEAEKFPRMRYLRQTTDRGLFGNIRRIVAQARGQFVWTIGDDDLVYPGAVEQIVSAIDAAPEIDMISLNFASWRAINPPAPATPIESLSCRRHGRLKQSGLYSTLCAVYRDSPEMLTPMYSFVLRRNHWSAAVQDAGDDNPCWTGVENTAPHAIYIIEHLLEKPVFYLHHPCVLGNFDVSWASHMRTWRQYCNEIKKRYRHKRLGAATRDAQAPDKTNPRAPQRRERPGK